MMLKYQDKKQLRKNKNTIRNTIVLGLFFLVTALGFWGVFGGPLNFISYPILKTSNWVSRGFYNSGHYFNSKKELFKENNFLIEENLSLKSRMIDYEIIEKENLELKGILNRINKNKEFVLGNILTKPNRSIYDTAILDIGKSDGVEIGYMVYAYGDIPIGEITETHDNTSLLTLFSSPGIKTEGFINDVNASVELIGRGGGNFETVIPLKLTIENGTMIYLPGFSSGVIAKVIDIISSPSDPFKKIILDSPVNIENLKWVQVKTN
jgi:cell shape-determining protein MreC